MNLLLNDNKFIIKAISFFIISLFFFTQVTIVNLGHFLAIIITISAITFYTQSDLDANEKILTKLVNLKTPDYNPKYMYIDASLIDLFDSIKKDFYVYNKKTYTSALKACDNLLKIRSEMELKLLGQPDIINILINFPEQKNKQTKSNTILVNAYHNYEAAEIQYKVCINYLYSYIINLPSNPVLHKKHSIIINKGNILLKRNLDIIYNIYMANKKVYDNDITDYDLQEPYNKFDDIKTITKSFEFI